MQSRSSDASGKKGKSAQDETHLTRSHIVRQEVCVSERVRNDEPFNLHYLLQRASQAPQNRVGILLVVVPKSLVHWPHFSFLLMQGSLNPVKPDSDYVLSRPKGANDRKTLTDRVPVAHS